jgi:hypothetical protein
VDMQDYAYELPRISKRRTSENTYSRQLGE